MNTTCATCRAFERDTAATSAYGQCKRMPPARDEDGDGVWPRVYSSDYCHKWLGQSHVRNPQPQHITATATRAASSAMAPGAADLRETGMLAPTTPPIPESQQ